MAGGLSGPSARSRRAGVAAGCRALHPPRAPPQPGPAPSRSKDTQKPLMHPLGLPPAARGGRKARDSAVWSQDAAVAERPASLLAGLPGRLGSGQLHGKRPVPRGHGAVITGVETEAVRARARPEPKGTWASGEPCPVHRPESLAQPRAPRGSARPCCRGSELGGKTGTRERFAAVHGAPWGAGCSKQGPVTAQKVLGRRRLRGRYASSEE